MGQYTVYNSMLEIMGIRIKYTVAVIGFGIDRYPSSFETCIEPIRKIISAASTYLQYRHD